MKPLFDTILLAKALPTDLFSFECEFCKKVFIKKLKDVKHALRPSRATNNSLSFCSRKCFNESINLKQIIPCTNCSKNVLKENKDIKRVKNIFCSKSCAATYNNLHKTTGTRRSKLEIWLEENLPAEYPNLKFMFNDKQTINSELDIYIPSLKLAFELNGIYHYEPIHGQHKFNQIQNNDNRKFQACLENNIELCIIDSSGLKYNKPEKFKKYFDIIKAIINSKNVHTEGFEPPTR